ncbi:uncharacterized protein PRCAT00000391001 [Priceomyces carsonii]|uniref:uncharacterized protein n=1 Tax=Priceomyces carsonii TaxID=28549 RepID=UPI002EDB706B|nr:unnamed protein product [Priceomyces carsonii]
MTSFEPAYSYATPQATPRRHKRKVDDIPKGDEISYHKRRQEHKLHSEIHNHTIALLMNSLKSLSEQKNRSKLQESPSNHDILEETGDKEFTYKQNPYWPVISKEKRI